MGGISSPCAGGRDQSQSSLRLRRTYFEAASAAACGYSRIRQDSGSGGGIYKPKLRGIADSIRCERIEYIPCRQYTAAGLIHPRVNPWCSVCDRIKSKLRFLLGLAAQFHPKKGDVCGHTIFRFDPIRSGTFSVQAVLPPFVRDTIKVLPLGSILFPELLRYYGQVRLPAGTAQRVMYSPPSFGLGLPAALSVPPGLPGSLALLRVHAISKHPGRHGATLLFSHRAIGRFPHMNGRSPCRHACNEAEASSLALRPALYLTLRPFPARLTPRVTPARRAGDFAVYRQLPRAELSSARIARALPGAQRFTGSKFASGCRGNPSTSSGSATSPGPPCAGSVPTVSGFQKVCPDTP